MHDDKVPFCIPYFSSSNIIQHHFCVNNDMGEYVTGYGMIIGNYLMVQLRLSDIFKHQVLQWDGVTVHMK